MNRRYTEFSQLKIKGEPKPPSDPAGKKIPGGEHRKIAAGPTPTSGGSASGGASASGKPSKKY